MFPIRTVTRPSLQGPDKVYKRSCYQSELYLYEWC